MLGASVGAAVGLRLGDPEGVRFSLVESNISRTWGPG
jgi:hypothetical protein